MMRRSTDANINIDQTDSMSGNPGRPVSEQFQLEPDLGLEAGMRGSLPKQFKRTNTNQKSADVKSPSFSPDLNCITENEPQTPQTVDSIPTLQTPPRPRKLNLATKV